METLESSRVCRLCGQQSGICINIFDKNENHVKKISAVLPILVHEMDLLPKQMCHRCSYKLEEFHKFYSDCLKTDRDLKSQLSWMRKREVKEDVRVPMVQIENVKIKTEPPDYDIYELDPIVENVNYINSMSTMTFSVNSVRNNNVDSSGIIDVDKCFTCDTRLAELDPPCECKYRKNKTNTSDAALAIKNTIIRPPQDSRKDSGSAVTGGSSRSNTQRNLLQRNKERQRPPKDLNELSLGNVSKNDKAMEIKIKTEKPDVSEPRSLRPRNKSIDYIGTKRKKSTLIVNPASVCRGAHLRRKSTAKKTERQIVNGIVIDEIKKEPEEAIHNRILRPRKLLVDYIGSKRKEMETGGSNTLEKSRCEDNRTKRRKSSNEPKAKANLSAAKRFTCLFPNLEFKVKAEIISDDKTLGVEQGAETARVVDSCGSDLGNLFDRENELAIKLENTEDGFLGSCRESSLSGSKTVSKLRSLKKLVTSKTQTPRKVPAKRISGTNCSPKYLRSQDLPLRNGKVKRTESDNLLSLASLKKRFLEPSKTGRAIGARNLPAKITENSNFIKVPTSLKSPNNIKRYCEKCNNSFMNRELYKLHACFLVGFFNAKI